MLPPNDLFSEIETAYHEHLLASGNLGPKTRENSWTGENSWTVGTPFARFHAITCTNCDHEDRIFLGYFEPISTPSGAKRERRVSRPSISGEREIAYSENDACQHCFAESPLTPNRNLTPERLRNRPTPEDL